MDKVERFRRAYEYLRNRGLVHTQKDLAEIMQATPPHVSLAFKGDIKYLTDSFLLRFNEAFGRIFNHQWLILGEGDRATGKKYKEKYSDFATVDKVYEDWKNYWDEK